MARPDETKRREDEAREPMPIDDEDDGEELELSPDEEDEAQKPEEKRAPGGRAERDRQGAPHDGSKEPGRR
jgi:hypothetical protein